MFKVKNSKEFKNGVVYALETHDGYLIEVTDTFLPYYTKDAIGNKQNSLKDEDIGSREERWMIGVSTMSGCPIKCKFCATSEIKRVRNLSIEEIIGQVEFILSKHPESNPEASKEFKINYTRMGEPFLNVRNVKHAIWNLNRKYSGIHHYVSTIGIKDSDFSWIENNITLQFSIHSFNDDYRNWLIPYANKMTLEEIAQVRVNSNLKITLNLSLVNESDFDIERLKELFDPAEHFIKLSPINRNSTSENNCIGEGIVEGVNLI